MLPIALAFQLHIIAQQFIASVNYEKHLQGGPTWLHSFIIIHLMILFISAVLLSSVGLAMKIDGLSNMMSSRSCMLHLLPLLPQVGFIQNREGRH